MIRSVLEKTGRLPGGGTTAIGARWQIRQTFEKKL